MKKSLIAALLLVWSAASGSSFPLIEEWQLTLRHREGNGIGFEDRYSTAALFLTPFGSECFQPYLDGRIHTLWNRFAANAGVGFRYSPGATCGIYGINGYYDYRDVPSFGAHQVGLGLEALYECVEFRLNGYIPVGTTRGITRSERFVEGATLVTEKERVAIPKLELDVASGFGWSCVDFTVGLTPYYLFKNHGFGGDFGVEARAKAKLFDGFSIGVYGSYDGLFKGRVSGVFEYVISLGPAPLKKSGRKWQCCIACDPCCEEILHQTKMQEPPHRAELIPIEKKTYRSNHNFFDFSRLNAIFFNNCLEGPGNGTFAAPFTTLEPLATVGEPNDLIYVFVGDGTSSGYDTGIALQEGQQLIGSGVSFDYFGFTIPPYPGDAGKYPLLSNSSGGAVVTLAEDTLVAGVGVQADGGVGIQGSGDLGTVTLRENTILGAPTEGISLALVGGTVANLIGNQITGADEGIRITLNDSNNQLIQGLIQGNVLTNSSSYGIHLSLAGNQATSTLLHPFTIENNQFTNSPFLVEQIAGTPKSNFVIPFSDNQTTSQFTFKNDGTAFDRNMLLVVPNPFPASQAGLEEANNGDTVTLQGVGIQFTNP